MFAASSVAILAVSCSAPPPWRDRNAFLRIECMRTAAAAVYVSGLRVGDVMLLSVYEQRTPLSVGGDVTCYRVQIQTIEESLTQRLQFPP